MKHRLLLLLLMLTSCTPAAPPTAIPSVPPVTVDPTKLPTPTMTITPTPYPTWSPVERFHYVLDNLGIDVNCSHLCWNGINPGVTSAAEAHAILGSNLWKDSDDGFNSGGVTIENDLVKSINIGSKGSSAIGFLFTGDFIEQFGDPAEIRIDFSQGMHCDPSTSYFVYYPSQKLTLFVEFSSPAGPRLDDDITRMVLNSEFDDATFDGATIKLFSYYPLDRTKHPFKRQPWLGFGHIRDYFPGRSWPKC